MTVQLVPGTHVATRSDRPFCRLALIVEDGAGRRIGLTARHILRIGNDDLVVDYATGKAIGRYLNLESDVEHNSHDNCRPLSEAIGAFELYNDPAIAISNASIVGVADPEDLVGKRVQKIDGYTPPHWGTVIGFGGEIVFQDPFSNVESIYGQPIIVEFDTVDAVRIGDAGTLLVDESGFAAGLLISAAKRHYAAPLAPYLAYHGFSLWRQPPNQAPTSLGIDASPIDRIADFQDSVKEMRAMMKAETPAHSDPEGKHVPEHLLALLEEAW